MHAPNNEQSYTCTYLVNEVECARTSNMTRIGLSCPLSVQRSTKALRSNYRNQIDIRGSEANVSMLFCRQHDPQIAVTSRVRSGGGATQYDLYFERLRRRNYLLYVEGDVKHLLNHCIVDSGCKPLSVRRSSNSCSNWYQFPLFITAGRILSCRKIQNVVCLSLLISAKQQTKMLKQLM